MRTANPHEPRASTRLRLLDWLQPRRAVLCSDSGGRREGMEQALAMSNHERNGRKRAAAEPAEHRTDPSIRAHANGAAEGVRALSGLPIGEEGVVVRLNGSRGSRLKLSSLGVLPGAGVVLEQRRPALVFRMGRSRFAVDEDLGSSIEVRATKNGRAFAKK